MGWILVARTLARVIQGHRRIDAGPSSKVGYSRLNGYFKLTSDISMLPPPLGKTAAIVMVLVK